MDKDPGSGGGDGGDGGTPLSKKKEILNRAMYNFQPTFRDFRGHPKFPNWMLNKDKDYVYDRLNEHLNDGEQKDEYAEHMEAILAFILNSPSLFKTKETFAFPASTYDDLANGTDVVFGIKDNKTGGKTVFSIDAATGTNVESIQKKFKTSIVEHDGTSRIKYCLHGKEKWSEPEATHLILGMSPASQDKAVSNIPIAANGEIVGRGEDLDTDFIILSEIKEQISMQLAIFRDKQKSDSTKQRISNLKGTLNAVTTALNYTLGIQQSDFASEEEYQKVREQRYTQKSKEMWSRDEVYKNILNEARRRKRLAIGSQALNKK